MLGETDAIQVNHAWVDINNTDPNIQYIHSELVKAQLDYLGHIASGGDIPPNLKKM